MTEERKFCGCKYEGDALISPFYLRLWQLVQTVLFKWNTLVILKYEMYNVPMNKKGYVRFYVPADAKFRYEIESFLQTEMQGDFQEPTDLGFPDGSGKFPGTDVEIISSVVPYSGLQPYVSRSVSMEMAKEMAQKLIVEVKKIRNKAGMPITKQERIDRITVECKVDEKQKLKKKLIEDGYRIMGGEVIHDNHSMWQYVAEREFLGALRKED